MCPPSWRSRSWHETASRSWAQQPTALAKELSTETISHAPLQTPFMGMPSGKGDSPRGRNQSPNAPLLSKATLAFFSPSCLGNIGQSAYGLPLASLALLLCRWSPELKSHYKSVLLRGEAGVGKKMPSGHGPVQSPQIQLGTSAWRPHLTHGSKRGSESCILETSTLLGKHIAVQMHICSAKLRCPFSPLALWSP